MVKVGRPNRTTAEQRRVIWEGWKQGQSLSEIGRALGKVPGSVFHVIKANGGFVPAERSRSGRVLSEHDREEISRGISSGVSSREIGRRIGRPASTVSREVKRNGGRVKYRAAVADAAAWERARRTKDCLLARDVVLRDAVAAKLLEDWSPEQIAGWLACGPVELEGRRVSHETIYKSLFIQARGVLKAELVKHLRSRRRMRRARTATTKGQTRGQIKGAISIHERPAEVEDRAVPGHWEGDLITGSGNSHIATLVERSSRFVMLVRVPGKDAVSVELCLRRQIKALPENVMRSLTWDRGTEMAEHKRFTVATDVKVFFADPHSPWQRGTNENTNRLLRQYFPKGASLAGFTQSDLDEVALKLNTRPRKTLHFATPADELCRITGVASTH